MRKAWLINSFLVFFIIAYIKYKSSPYVKSSKHNSVQKSLLGKVLNGTNIARQIQNQTSSAAHISNDAVSSGVVQNDSTTFLNVEQKHVDLFLEEESQRNLARCEDRPPPIYNCTDPGESYSASYLTRKEPLLRHRYGISPAQHMETGGTVFRRHFFPVKTINMFDFGVEHLSWLERRIGSTTLPPMVKKIFVEELMEHLRQRQNRLMRKATLAPSLRHDASSKVIGLMPFYGGGSGDAGHSVPELRRLYLNLSFWSFYRHVKDLAVCVCTDTDKNWLLNYSGLPWYDIIKENCRVNVTKEKGKVLSNPYIKWKPSLLGVLTSRRAQKNLRDGIWPHEWIFYTESDQVLFVRNFHQMLNLTNEQTNYVAPHRLVPLPTSKDFPLLSRWLKTHRTAGHALVELQRNSARPLVRFAEEAEGSCCFDQGTCKNRSHWKSWLRLVPSEWPMIKVDDSFPLLPGEGNFLRMSFRMCTVNIQQCACSSTPSLLQ